MFHGYLRSHACAGRYLRVLLLGLLCFAIPAWGFQIDAPKLRELAAQRYGAKGAANVGNWLEMLGRAKGQSEPEQLTLVNRFWNQTIKKAEDMQVWGQADYWATPLESLGKGAGDGEDYVIGKYYSLIAIGVPVQKLRFVYVLAHQEGLSGIENLPHMVLGYYPSAGAVPLVLDNLNGEISPASQRADLTPIFIFDAGANDATSTTDGPMGRLSRWRDLLSRMGNEGISP